MCSWEHDVKCTRVACVNTRSRGRHGGGVSKFTVRTYKVGGTVAYLFNTGGNTNQTNPDPSYATGVTCITARHL